LISGSNGEELSVPYFGVAADLKRDIPDMFYSQENYPRIVSGLNKTLLEDKSRCVSGWN
jgi:hypothetical protein